MARLYMDFYDIVLFCVSDEAHAETSIAEFPIVYRETEFSNL